MLLCLAFSWVLGPKFRSSGLWLKRLTQRAPSTVLLKEAVRFYPTGCTGYLYWPSAASFLPSLSSLLSQFVHFPLVDWHSSVFVWVGFVSPQGSPPLMSGCHACVEASMQMMEMFQGGDSRSWATVVQGGSLKMAQ